MRLLVHFQDVGKDDWVFVHLKRMENTQACGGIGFIR
jgi:hypothetical protein